jgi:tetratricopeptide (TPR) repeat protein
VALPFIAASLGSAYLWLGRAPDAVTLLEEAIAAFTRMAIQGLHSLSTTFLAEAYLELGRVGEAREQAEQALALARVQRERGWEAWALRLLGAIHARKPAEAEQAGEAYRQALTIATELGMRPLVAHCHIDLYGLHFRAGQHEAAGAHLSIATTLYRDMDMRFWLEHAEQR